MSYAQLLKDTVGIASFYGDKFNGRKTSSGEKFDNKKFTAAHRTLPFNTMVLVTNPKNDKSVVVKINDRGPFTKGRIIDVSKAAASELDIVRAGTAKVYIRVIDSTFIFPIENDSLPIVENGIQSNDSTYTIEKVEVQNVNEIKAKSYYYGVQVASLADMTNINKTKDTIKKITKEEIFVFTYNTNGKELHQVVVGDFKKQKDAIALRKKLEVKFKGAFVTHYKN